MSWNTALNAVLALIEGRPEDARAVLRSSEAKDLGMVQVRVLIALDHARKQAVIDGYRRLLTALLRITPDPAWELDRQEPFLEGIVAAEELLDQMIGRLKTELEEEKDQP